MSVSGRPVSTDQTRDAEVHGVALHVVSAPTLQTLFVIDWTWGRLCGRSKRECLDEVVEDEYTIAKSYRAATAIREDISSSNPGCKLGGN